MTWYRSSELNNAPTLQISLLLVLIKLVLFKPQFYSILLLISQLSFIVARTILIYALSDIYHARYNQIELERNLLMFKPQSSDMTFLRQTLFSNTQSKNHTTLKAYKKMRTSKRFNRKVSYSLIGGLQTSKSKDIFDFFVLYIVNCQTSALAKFDLIHPNNRWYVKYALRLGPQTTTLAFDFQIMFNMWADTYNLLVNIAFYKIKIFTFGRLEFKQMIESFNWLMWPFSTLEWRDNTQYFYNAPSIYSTTYRNFFEKFSLKIKAIHFFFDCHYHHKTLKYLSDLPVVVIGTMDLALNPWYVTYPLPIATNSFFSHYFVYSFLLKAFRHAEYQIYEKMYVRYNQIAFFMTLQRLNVLLCSCK